MATSERRPPPPPGVWRGLGLAAVLLLLSAIAAIGLISAGVFDPRPTGDVANRRDLSAQEIPGGETQLTWHETSVAGSTFTVRLSAAWATGEQDVGYGVVVGEQEGHLAAAVSPLGYAAVWMTQAGRREMLFPWQLWPHVHRGSETNEIQIQVEDDSVHVRVNRERLWEGQTKPQGAAVGLLAQSFGQGAVIDFQTLVTFTPTGAVTPAKRSP